MQSFPISYFLKWPEIERTIWSLLKEEAFSYKCTMKQGNSKDVHYSLNLSREFSIKHCCIHNHKLNS